VNEYADRIVSLGLADKDWAARFEANDRKSGTVDLDFWFWPCELLGCLGLLVFLMIAAVDYFRRARVD